MPQFTININGTEDEDALRKAYSYIQRRCTGFRMLPNENRGGMSCQITSTQLTRDEIISELNDRLPEGAYAG